MTWHQMGVAYRQAGQPEAAEDGYRKALAIRVRLGDVAGQAATLGQLGNLYDAELDRPEEALAFHRQAADRYTEIGNAANEGVARSNLANTLRRLRRLDESRREIRRAIECDEQFGHASQPWMSWAVLADIEADAGNPTAALEEKREAIASYLAYRRDGGENHNVDGRICLAVTQALLSGDSAGATSELQGLAAHPELPSDLLPFLHALQGFVAGSRDRRLADSHDLHYREAAEILFLIGTLEQPR